MTDKTDIAALTRPVRDRYDWSNAVWRDCDQCGKQHTGTVTAEDGSQICAHCADQLYWSAWQVLAERALDQLEAERQRADANAQEIRKLEFQWEHRAPTQWAYDQACTALHAQRERAEKAELELIKPLPIGELIQRLEGQTYEKWFSQSDLKGDQVPVAVVELNDNLSVAEIRGDIPRRKAVRELYEGALVLGQELFGAPQKPGISKEKLCDWLEDNFDIDDSQRAAFAACFAHCCDCIVQSDSSSPVGEIVAWAGTDREKGITREVDFRFLRFDVMPGTKLYALKPAPAMLTDVLAAIRVGGSPTELIEALTAIKPKFGAPGSRDVDVRAANLAIDKAIEKLSNL
ncbi:hypothetical protein AB6869_19880 [Rahnella rivi]|uniref:hypothetical protein n=1 Tax=Rahnella rivi TaxID=2816249 RepID=UPI0039BE74B8